MLLVISRSDNAGHAEEAKGGGSTSRKDLLSKIDRLSRALWQVRFRGTNRRMVPIKTQVKLDISQAHIYPICFFLATNNSGTRMLKLGDSNQKEKFA